MKRCTWSELEALSPLAGLWFVNITKLFIAISRDWEHGSNGLLSVFSVLALRPADLIHLCSCYMAASTVFLYSSILMTLLSTRSSAYAIWQLIFHLDTVFIFHSKNLAHLNFFLGIEFEAQRIKECSLLPPCDHGLSIFRTSWPKLICLKQRGFLPPMVWQ